MSNSIPVPVLSLAMLSHNYGRTPFEWAFDTVAKIAADELARSSTLEALLLKWRTSDIWWEQQAWQSVERGWYREITAGGELYLLRLWMTTPTPVPGPERFESGNCTLLHYFSQPDPALCFHDHPWDFTTTVLAGGYQEEVPLPTWPGRLLGYGPPAVGCRGRIHTRQPGRTVEHRADDLHVVTKLLQDNAWTLVRTGPRVRDWGFYPLGQQRVDPAQFVARGRPCAEPWSASVVSPLHPLDDPNGAH